MVQVKKVSPGDPVSAGEYNKIVEAVNGGVSSNPPGLNGLFVPPVLVRNDSGEDLARYDTARLGDPLYELQADGSVDLIFKLLKADAAKPPVVLAEPIADTRFGRVWIYGLAYAFVGPGSASISTAKSDPTNNRLTPDASGSVRLLAPPNASTEKLLPVLVGGSSPLDAITDVRISGLKFQYTKDGATWVDWHSGSNC